MKRDEGNGGNQLLFIQIHSAVGLVEIRKRSLLGVLIHAYPHVGYVLRTCIQAYMHRSIRPYKHKYIQPYVHTSIRAYKHTCKQACTHVNIIIEHEFVALTAGKRL